MIRFIMSLLNDKIYIFRYKNNISIMMVIIKLNEEKKDNHPLIYLSCIHFSRPCYLILHSLAIQMFPNLEIPMCLNDSLWIPLQYHCPS